MRRLPFLPFVMAVALASPAALAKPPAPKPAPVDDAEERARTVVKRGLAAFARGEPEAALTDFVEAQRLVPNANLPYRYAAEALAALERYDEAIVAYEKYLSVNPDVSDADAVRARIAEVKKKSVGEVAIQSRPPGAAVLVDGATEPSGATPIPSLVLPRGPHTFVLRLEGYREATLSADLGGARVQLYTELAPVPTAEPPRPLAPPPAEPNGSSWTRQKTGFVVGAAGLVLVGGGAVLDATWVSSRVDAFERARAGSPADEALARQDEARTSQLVTTSTVVAGVVALAVGAALVLWPTTSSRTAAR